MLWWPRVAEAVPIDTAWLKAHPLPDHQDNVDKNGRGRVLVIGGCRRVPGGMLLTAEAAFRAGAGKVTIATIASAAIPIGIAFPSCAVVALPETEAGEIAPQSAELLLAEIALHDAIVFGPAMIDADIVQTLLEALLPALPDDMFLLLDAFALRAAAAHADAIRARAVHTVLTPHEGELAAMLNIDKEVVADDPLDALGDAADRFGAAVMVKGATSHLIAEGKCLAYAAAGSGSRSADRATYWRVSSPGSVRKGSRPCRRRHGVSGCTVRRGGASRKPWGRSAISHVSSCRSSPS